MVKVDIHKYNKRVENALRRIREGDSPEQNKKDLYEFYEYLGAEGISKGRIAKYLYHMHKICEISKIPFNEMNKKDIIGIVSVIERRDYSPHTKHDYKIALKRFFHWLKGTKVYPEEVEWIKSTLKNCNSKLPDDLLADEDIKKLVGAANHPRNKAMVSFLFESGCRIGEMLSVKLKHLSFDKFGCLAILDGKTGMRKIRIVACVPHLSLWIENHPFKDDKEAYLWVSINNQNRKTPILYQNVSFLLKKLAKRAGVTKKVNPHNFRHSRATQMANHLTDSQMDHYFGWVQGSKMPSVYVHLSGRDMDDAILKMNGIKIEETEKKNHFAPQTCLRCEKQNSPTNKICTRCGSPLDSEAAMESESYRKKRGRMMDIMMGDPETQKFLINKMRNLLEMEWYKSTKEPYPAGAVPGDSS